MSIPPSPTDPLYQDEPQPFGSMGFPQEFLEDIRMQIVNASGTSGLTKDKVFWSRHSTTSHLKFPPADQFVALSLPSMMVNQNYVTGGGVYNTQFDGTVLVRIFDRIESDIENRDANQLTDQVLGQLKFSQQILTCLQTWNGPIDNEDGDSVFNRPMRLIGSIDLPDRDGPNGTRWGITQARFELPFVADLSYPYPSGGSPPPVLTGPNYWSRNYFG
jgi:hypothetical protein